MPAEPALSTCMPSFAFKQVLVDATLFEVGRRLKYLSQRRLQTFQVLVTAHREETVTEREEKEKGRKEARGQRPLYAQAAVWRWMAPERRN